MELVTVPLIEWRVGSSMRIFLIRDGLITSILARVFISTHGAHSPGQVSNHFHEFGHPQVL
jgi:hypothetical protein